MRSVIAAVLAGAILSAEVRPQLYPAARISSGGGYTASFGTGDADGDGATDLLTQATSGGLILLRGAADGGFLPPLLIEGADLSLAQRMADVTGDGLPDLVTTDFNTLTVRPGLGAVQFGAPVVTNIVNFTFDPLLADLNGDGRADVVLDPFSDPFSGVVLAYGQPDGSFLLAGNLTDGGHFSSRELHDVTDDGVPDIAGVLAVSFSGKIRTSVLPGTGAGSFGAPISSVVSGSGYSQCMHATVTDLDLDGQADMAILAGQYLPVPELRIVLARGVGDGSFLAAGSFTVPPEDSVLQAADMDGDGLPDLVCCGNLPALEGTPGAVHVWRNTGGFRFESRPRALVGGVPTALALLDVDADGVLDAVLGHQPFLISGPPAPGQGQEHVQDDPGDPDGGANDGANGDAGSGVATLLTDFSIVRGRGDGSFASAGQVLAGAPLERVTTADLNDDAVPDLLVGGGSGTQPLRFAAGVGDGSFLPVLVVGGVLPADLFELTDLDGDGHVDLVLSSPVGLVTQRGTGALDATGAPAFEAPVLLDPAGMDALAVADMDGDGVPDIVTTRAADHAVLVRSGVGDGSCEPAVAWDCALQATGLALADLTADGRPDVLLASATDRHFAVLVANAGGFRAPVLTALNVPRDRIASADLDGDGLRDVVLAGSGAVGLTALRGLGDGSFAPLPAPTTIGPVSALRLADLTGDGRPDLLALHLLARVACVWPGGPGGAFGPPAYFTTQVSPADAGIADLDGDGLQDLAIGCLDGTAWILLNQLSEWVDLGGALAASFGTPQLVASGPLAAGQAVSMLASGVPARAWGALILGFGTSYLPYAGGTLVPTPQVALELHAGLPVGNEWPAGVAPGTPVCVQAWFLTAGPAGHEISASRALLALTP